MGEETDAMAETPPPEIEPPPGLNFESEPEAEAEVESERTELPKPRIAYHVANEAMTPVPDQSLEARKIRVVKKTSPAAAPPGGGPNPMVRYCVHCGMQVAPKLISAKFCVYCGNVHSGKSDQAMLAEALTAYMASPTGYMGDFGAPYSANTAMQWQGWN